MTKEDYIKLTNEKLKNESSKIIMIKQIESYYNAKENYKIENKYNIGDDVFLPRGTLLHGTYKNIDGLKEIVKDVMFLSQKAEAAIKEDKYIANDLLDTLKANKDRCVGLAANMIGYKKAIICVSGGLYDFIMINPVIINKNGENSNPNKKNENILNNNTIVFILLFIVYM